MIINRQEHYGTGERIRDLMKEKGYDQKQLAELVGVSDTRAIRRWLNEGVFPARMIKKLAKVLDCDPEYLRCKQNTPRKQAAFKIRLTPISTTDKYLPKIQALMDSTAYRFTYGFDPVRLSEGEEIEGSFIEGETKYHYTDYVFDYEGSIDYIISVNGSGPIRVSEAKMESFVRSVVKTISREIKQLKEEKEMYPNVTKEMNRKNMTIEELAQAIGADQEELADKLRGKSPIKLSESMRIKTAIGSDLPLEVLFETENS